MDYQPINGMPAPVNYPVRAPAVPPVWGWPVQGLGFGWRAAAFCLDLALAGALNYGGATFFNQITQELLSPANRVFHVDIQINPIPGELALGIAWAFLLVYFVLFEWIFGATPGKWILRMRVIRRDGRPCGLGAALVRGLARLVDGVGLGFVAGLSMTPPLRQRFGDRWARTLVVSAREPWIRPQRPTGYLVLASALVVVLALPAFQSLRIGLSLGAPTPLATAEATAEATPDAPQGVAGNARDFNLRLSDLGAGFSLVSDRRIDRSDNRNVLDGSQRVFRSREGTVTAQVVLFTRSVTGATASEIRDVLEKDIHREYGILNVETKGQRITAMGKPGWALLYGEKKTGKHIVGLMYIHYNVVVNLMVYGNPEEVDIDHAEAFAQTIFERLLEGGIEPSWGDQIGALDGSG